MCQQRDPGPESGHPGRRSRTDEGVCPSTNGQELLLGTGARHDPLVLWPSHRMSGEMGVIDDNVTTDAHRMACQVPDDPVAVSGRDDQLVFGGIVADHDLGPHVGIGHRVSCMVVHEHGCVDWHRPALTNCQLVGLGGDWMQVGDFLGESVGRGESGSMFCMVDVFADAGLIVAAVMTDNGSCYRSDLPHNLTRNYT